MGREAGEGKRKPEPVSRSGRELRNGNRKISVAMRIGETPVPIPNTKVKTYPAEDTAGATLWESRWPPN